MERLQLVLKDVGESTVRANSVRATTVDPFVTFTTYGACPTYGTVFGYTLNHGKPWVTCSYLRSALTPDRVVKALATSSKATMDWTNAERARRSDPTFYDDLLMNEMCGNAADDSTTCPETSKLIDKSTGKKICSNLIACPMCREWAMSGAGTTIGAYRTALSDDIIQTWCNANTDRTAVDDATRSDEACRCVNRAYSPQLSKFTDAGATGIINDASCWYPPCSTGGNFMRYLVRSNERNKTCGNFCANIINFANAENINMSDVEMVNECKSQIPPEVTCPSPCYTGTCPAGCPSTALPPQPNVTCPSPCYAATCPAGCVSVQCPSPCYTGSCPAGCPSTTPPTPDPEWLVWAKANKKMIGVGVGSATSIIAVLVLFKMLASKKK